jgi:hypothetical protein
MNRHAQGKSGLDTSHSYFVLIIHAEILNKYWYIDTA